MVSIARMPFNDPERKRAYFRDYMARKRAAGEATWETREKKTAAKRREREAKRLTALEQRVANIKEKRS